jgi:hypothetical protein
MKVLLSFAFILSISPAFAQQIYERDLLGQSRFTLFTFTKQLTERSNNSRASLRIDEWARINQLNPDSIVILTKQDIERGNKSGGAIRGNIVLIETFRRKKRW